MMIKPTACLLSLILPALVLAQDATDESAEEEIRRYTVEVIIFRYAQDVGTGNEMFLPDELVEEVAADGLELIDEVPQEPEPQVIQPLEPEEEPEPLPDIELVLLEEESYQLVDAYERLERLDAYEPVMHFGWTQATWPEEQTEAIPLHLFARPPEELDGSLTLYLGRYLHLVVELQWRAPETAIDAAAPAQGLGGLEMPAEATGELVSPPVYYRISEDRIMRNGEVRYYDHPKFGLLAKVTRVEEEAPADPGELLGYPVQ
jgi:hypothetical protein